MLVRAANNGRSTGNVRSELGIYRTNPWIAAQCSEKNFEVKLKCHISDTNFWLGPAISDSDWQLANKFSGKHGLYLH